MNDTPIPVSAPAAVASALHHVFATSAHAPDTLEVWLAVTAEATRQLTGPAVVSPWLPVFVVYRGQRTDARYHAVTAVVRITSGPLAGVTYTDPASAAYAVAVVHPGTDCVTGDMPVPTWRLTRTGSTPPSRPAGSR